MSVSQIHIHILLEHELTYNAKVSTVSRVLEYNETFAESSDASNAAWKALIPHRGGFFNPPTLARHRSVFSVFHQLHCLVISPLISHSFTAKAKY